jgi:hypothetical protein
MKSVLRWTLGILLAIAIVAAVWGTILAEKYVKDVVLEQSTKEVSLALAEPVPEWVCPSLKQKIIEQANVGLERITAEPGNAATIAMNLNSRLVWLKDVRVKTFKDYFTIEAQYRKPAITIEYKKNRYYLATDKTVLDYIPIDTLDIPLVTGCVLTDEPEPGDSLFHEQLKAAVELTMAFRHMDEGRGRKRKLLPLVKDIDVSRQGIAGSDRPQILIHTTEGVDIYWGAAIGEADSYHEKSSTAKLSGLYTILEAHNSLAGRYREIDLRYE